MITAVKDALQRQQYLRAAQGYDYFRAVLGLRLALYGDKPASGWHFYTGGRGACAALAVRGETAFSCGAWDEEELTAFLRFLGVCRRLTPDNGKDTAPQGRTLHLYTLAPGGRVTEKPSAVPFDTECDPPMRQVTNLLWGSEPDADAFYAEACSARNRGMAEFRVALIDGQAAATVGACAIYAGEAYMAAGETAVQWRGKGIGGALIAALANELSARGLRVTLLCEDALCPFYERMGFHSGAVYLLQEW